MPIAAVATEKQFIATSTGSFLNLSTKKTEVIITIKTIIVDIVLIISNSCTTFDNSSLSSRTFAVALIPYVEIPKDANRVAYVAIDVKNETLPVPSANKILDTYGKVINGNIVFDIV